MILHTQTTTVYEASGLVWVHAKHMLLRIRTNYFMQLVAQCPAPQWTQTTADAIHVTLRWSDEGGWRGAYTVFDAYDTRVSTMPIARLQRRWRRVLRERRGRRLTALAMSAHARLGRASALHALDSEVLGLISNFVQ
jgi:hypothetical protein